MSTESKFLLVVDTFWTAYSFEFRTILFLTNIYVLYIIFSSMYFVKINNNKDKFIIMCRAVIILKLYSI